MEKKNIKQLLRLSKIFNLTSFFQNRNFDFCWVDEIFIEKQIKEFYSDDEVIRCIKEMFSEIMQGKVFVGSYVFAYGDNKYIYVNGKQYDEVRTKKDIDKLVKNILKQKQKNEEIKSFTSPFRDINKYSKIEHWTIMYE